MILCTVGSDISGAEPRNWFVAWLFCLLAVSLLSLLAAGMVSFINSWLLNLLEACLVVHMPTRLFCFWSQIVLLIF